MGPVWREWPVERRQSLSWAPGAGGRPVSRLCCSPHTVTVKSVHLNLVFEAVYDVVAPLLLSAYACFCSMWGDMWPLGRWDQVRAGGDELLFSRIFYARLGRTRKELQ